MKILMLLDRCGLQEGSLYGPLLELIYKIGERNHVIHVLTRRTKSQHIKPNDANGVFIHSIPVISEKIIHKFILFFIQLMNAIKLMRKFRFDVIYSHIEGYLGLINVIIGKIFRRRSFHWICGAFWYYERKESGVKKFLNWSVKVVLRAVDVIITCTNWMKEGLMREWNISSNKIEILPNSVEIDRFNPNIKGTAIKRKLGIKDEKIILFIHHLSPRKGAKYLIKAIPLIKNAISNLKCIIIGEGAQKSYLQSLAENLGIPNDLIFTGSVPSRNVPEYLAMADVLVVSSVIEEFGRVLIEGMACKTPIVATNVGGIPEVAPNEEVARLIPPRSHDAIANAVVEILTDQALSDRLIQNGYERVMKFYTQQIVAKKFTSVLCNYSNADVGC